MKKGNDEEGSSLNPSKEIKIDEADAPYLDLRDDWELERYMMIKDREFKHTPSLDLDSLMEKELEDTSHNEGRKNPSRNQSHQLTFEEKIILEVDRRAEGSHELHGTFDGSILQVLQ